MKKKLKHFKKGEEKSTPVAPSEWHSHFNNLLNNCNYDRDEQFGQEIDSHITEAVARGESFDDLLDAEITTFEMQAAVNKLPNEKSSWNQRNYK
ncbi:hypothetical protein SNE40_019832 [Patella caerulea]|uniref:Uncharacterized protein n=1 Tax=Patella caerulea TaxID=87958 RepID=A0AAN8G9W1_PATCE